MFSCLSVALIKAGISSGLLLEIMLSSLTTSASTKVAPAFLISCIIDFHPVILRPFIAWAVIKSCGAWHIAKTGLPLSTNFFVKSTASSSTLNSSGEYPPGIKRASKSFINTSLTDLSIIADEFPRLPLTFSPF